MIPFDSPLESEYPWLLQGVEGVRPTLVRKGLCSGGEWDPTNKASIAVLFTLITKKKVSIFVCNYKNTKVCKVHNYRFHFESRIIHSSIEKIQE